MNDLERMNEILYELSTDDLIIERIELIDMISPPARTKATMEPHLKTTEQDSENLPPSHSATNLQEIFGVYDEGEFFDLLNDYSLSDFPSAPLRSLSIPLSPGLSGAWAPNGYGKTFAMKNILSKLQQAKGNNPTEVFDDFMYKCTRFRDNESSNIFQNGWQSDGLGRFYSQETIQRNQSVELIPFREINILTSSGHVIRFLPQYDKSGNYSHETFTKIYRKKFDEDFTFIYDDVKVPNWLCHTQGELLLSTEISNDWGDKEVDLYYAIQDRCFAIIESLALDYIEIPRLSYSQRTFEKISENFKQYLSGLLGKDFESEFGPLDDYGTLDLVKHLDEVTSKRLELSDDNFFSELFLELLEIGDDLGQFDDVHSINFSFDRFNFSHIREVIHSQLGKDGRYDISAMPHIVEELKNGIKQCQDQIEEDIISQSKEYFSDEEFLSGNLLDFEELDYTNLINDPRIFKQRYETLLYRIDNHLPSIKVEDNTIPIPDIVRNFESRLNSNMSDSHDPWSIKVKLLNWKVEPNSNVFAFEYENGSETNQYRATWDTLSFGQKSHFIIQSMLILEEGMNKNESESFLQRCLVIDEPESGKAESWVSQLIADLQAQHSRLKDRKKSSVLILSHRGVVLDSITDDGVYSLMFTPEIDEDMDEDEED